MDFCCHHDLCLPRRLFHRSLKLWQACVIAIFTEFGGAILLGAETASTVKDGIINTASFSSRPDLLMSGFMCALIASSTWVMFATSQGWPVSTTHSIIGALIGVGVSGFGFGAVNWGWDNKGVAQIVTSWFVSPILAGLLAAVAYLLTKYFILRSKNSLKRGIYAIPFFFCFAIFVVTFYVTTKNGSSTLKIGMNNGSFQVQGNVGLAFAIIGAVTAACAIFCVAFLCPYFYRKLVKGETLQLYHVPIIWCMPEQPADPLIEIRMKYMFTPDRLTDDERRDIGLMVASDQKLLEDGKGKVVEDGEGKVVEDGEEKMVDDEMAPKRKNFSVRIFGMIKNRIYTSLFMDVATVQQENTHAAEAHEIAIVYDPKTEYLYSMLQVVTASFASFAHGSNDVANALGPLAGVYQIWETGTFSKSASVPKWMLAYAGFGIDCGLALYGYKIMRTLGNNITFHSPSRGFCMELGAALSVITASFMGLPVSTTQCIVGATVAVGLCHGQIKAINWIQVAWCFFSWFLTLPVAAITAGVVYAIITRGPSFTLPPGY